MLQNIELTFSFLTLGWIGCNEQGSTPCIDWSPSRFGVQCSCKNKFNPVQHYVNKKVNALFSSKYPNHPSVMSESLQSLNLLSLPRAFFGRIKNSIAPCSFTESKLPSSNTLGEADVLQGPTEVTGVGGRGDASVLSWQDLKLGCQILFLNTHISSPKDLRDLKNLINCAESEF